VPTLGGHATLPHQVLYPGLGRPARFIPGGVRRDTFASAFADGQAATIAFAPPLPEPPILTRLTFLLSPVGPNCSDGE